MKITILAFPLLVRHGGPPNAVISILNVLSEIKKIDLNLILFGDYDSSLSSRIPTTTNVIHQRVISKSIYSFFIRWDKEAKKTIKDSEVVLIHGFYFWYTLRLFFMKNQNFEIYLMPHGVFEPYQKSQSKIRKYLFDSILRKKIDKADSRFIVASDSEVKGVKEKFSNKAIEISGLPIEIPALYKMKSPSILDLNGEINLLHLGRIAEKKRIDLTIKCLADFKKKGINIKFNVIGDGNESLKKDLLNLAKREEVESEVIFHGQLDGRFMYEKALNNHVLVLPSENENFAISVAEALLMGIPCVVSENVALSKIISEHNLGVVINSLEVDLLSAGILRIMEDYENFRKSVSNCSALFSPDYFIKKFGK